eukprot:13843816-Heterocapsa_arctica.AAC.1
MGDSSSSSGSSTSASAYRGKIPLSTGSWRMPEGPPLRHHFSGWSSGSPAKARHAPRSVARMSVWQSTPRTGSKSLQPTTPPMARWILRIWAS